jgi:tetratricopeptide (TPR) repeat protein
MRRQRHRAARLAAWLTPHDADAHLALGVYLLERRRARPAIRPLQQAVQLAPQRGDAQCCLALACARLFREDEFDAAQAKAMSLLGNTSDLFLPDLAAAWRRVAAGERLLRSRVKGIDARVAGRNPASAAWQLVTFQWKYAYFMAGRRLNRWSGSMLELPVLLAQRADWVTRMDGVIAERRAQAARLRKLAPRRAEIDSLAGDREDRSKELEALRDESAAKGWTWEAGHIAAALGRVAMRQRRFEDACRWFQQAIDIFEPEYPAEIGSRGLHARLALALLASGKRGEALDAARRAVAIDPMNEFERNQLADCHFELKEWSRARAEWEESLRYAPDQPITYYNIATCWYNEASAADNGTLRRQCLTHAAEHLERALSLFASDDPARLDGQFLLGRIRCAMGNVNDGLALWQALESREFRPIYLGLNVADAMLREVSLDQAQARFEGLAADLESRCQGDAELVHQPIAVPQGDSSRATHGEALVWAELGIALAMARRQGGFDDALAHAGKARAAVANIDDSVSRQHWSGNCDRIEGEILLRKGDMAGAIRLLESGLVRSNHVENYRYLAAALLQQMDPAVDDSATRFVAARIKSLLDHAEKIDLDDELKPAVAELRARLAKTAASKWI